MQNIALDFPDISFITQLSYEIDLSLNIEMTTLRSNENVAWCCPSETKLIALMSLKPWKQGQQWKDLTFLFS